MYLAVVATRRGPAGRQGGGGKHQAEMSALREALSRRFVGVRERVWGRVGMRRQSPQYHYNVVIVCNRRVLGCWWLCLLQLYVFWNTGGRMGYDGLN